MGTSVIVKVQRPLFPANQKGDWMFYNKDKSIFFTVKPPPDVVEMMGDDFKMYARAKVIRRKLVISRRVRNRPW